MAYVIANWKMHGDTLFWHKLMTGYLAINAENPAVQLVACVPAVALKEMAALARESTVSVAAQAVFGEKQGAFSGETSAVMAADVGASYTLIGHSEYRMLHPLETYASHLMQAVDAGLTPVVCIGETYDEYLRGDTNHVLKRQLADVFEQGCPDKVLIAYEPRWSISAAAQEGIVATPQTVAPIFATIAATCQTLGVPVSLLYGGSVSAENVSDFMAIPEVSGVLVGGNSLKRAAFGAIVAAVNEIRN